MPIINGLINMNRMPIIWIEYAYNKCFNAVDIKLKVSSILPDKLSVINVEVTFGSLSITSNFFGRLIHLLGFGGTNSSHSDLPLVRSTLAKTFVCGYKFKKSDIRINVKQDNFYLLSERTKI